MKRTISFGLLLGLGLLCASGAQATIKTLIPTNSYQTVAAAPGLGPNGGQCYNYIKALSMTSGTNASCVTLYQGTDVNSTKLTIVCAPANTTRVWPEAVGGPASPLANLSLGGAIQAFFGELMSVTTALGVSSGVGASDTSLIVQVSYAVKCQ